MVALVKRYYALVLIAFLILPQAAAASDGFMPIEHQIAGLHYERAIAYDASGQMLFDTAGAGHYTLVNYPYMNLLWDGIVTHNHPSGRPAPSYADLNFAWYWQLKAVSYTHLTLPTKRIV